LLVGENLKDRVQIRDLKQITDFRRQVDQLDGATAAFRGDETLREGADPSAVNEIHLSEIQKDFLPVLSNEFMNQFAHALASFAQRDAPVQIDNDDVADLAWTRSKKPHSYCPLSVVWTLSASRRSLA
jgi:hypothetical protein